MLLSRTAMSAQFCSFLASWVLNDRTMFLLRVLEVCLLLELLTDTLEGTMAAFGIKYLFGGDIPHILNLLILVLKVDVLHVSS
jgi:hypothetical protein